MSEFEPRHDEPIDVFRADFEGADGNHYYGFYEGTRSWAWGQAQSDLRDAVTENVTREREQRAREREERAQGMPEGDFLEPLAAMDSQIDRAQRNRAEQDLFARRVGSAPTTGATSGSGLTAGGVTVLLAVGAIVVLTVVAAIIGKIF